MTIELQKVKMDEGLMVSSDSTTNRLSEVCKLIKVISSIDALLILSMAKDGIEADTSTHSRIDLTRKQYYTRLMQLKNAGLIKKEGKFYYQTTMGSFLQENCIDTIIHAIRNSKKMTMIDVLKSNGNFSKEDLLKIESSVCIIPLSGTD